MLSGLTKGMLKLLKSKKQYDHDKRPFGDKQRKVIRMHIEEIDKEQERREKLSLDIRKDV